MREITILGSTGSIGRQALEVCKALGYRVLALSANKNINILQKQIYDYKPKYAVLADKACAEELKMRLKGSETIVLGGAEAVCTVASLPQNDIVLNAIVGIAGLRPTVAALSRGCDIALANKESLVTGGKLVTELAKKTGARILPVDSEHSAIFQCIGGFDVQNKPKKLLLTASGGPFFGKTRPELQGVKKEAALKHPNWSMGAKITIDSATMMNKGLEVIEAVWLFGILPRNIEVVVQRESIIHSAVEFEDNSVIAQMGVPDMKIPIQYALTYPKRLPCKVEQLSLTSIGKLSFFKPDTQTFECLSVCIDAITKGGLAPAIVNGANEQAVELFLDDKIEFLQIGTLVRRALNELLVFKEEYELEDIFEADELAREFVKAAAECLKAENEV
ncbi:MAG: 1-deoxy-D-xylulose-5-phosphate reductoisomerase [Hydrogenoanaerobacterium sp.]